MLAITTLNEASRETLQFVKCLMMQSATSTRATGSHRVSVPSCSQGIFNLTVGKRRDVRRPGCPLSALAADKSATDVDPDTGFVMTQAAYKAAFSSVEMPLVQGVRAKIEGSVPKWLKGAFVRNGPGVFGDMLHLFDGYGLIVSVDFEDGSAVFKHKFVESEAYRAYRDTGKMKWREFGTPLPMSTPLEIAAELGRTVLGITGVTQGITDNASVNILPWRKGTGLAVTENVDAMYEIDVASLNTLNKVKYSDRRVPGQLTTAHPVHVGNDRLINITNDPMGGITVFSHQRGGAARENLGLVPKRDGRGASWVHAFPCSNKWAVIPQYPAYMDLTAITFGKDVENGYGFIEWQPQDGVLLTAIKLDGSGERRTFRAPTHFCYHFSNCFESEDGKDIIFDASVYEDAAESLASLVMNGPKVDPTKEIPPSRFMRFRLPLSKGGKGPDDACPIGLPDAVGEAELEAGWEFPVFNEAWRGKESRFSWGCCARRPARYLNALAKVDAVTGDVKTWCDPGAIPGEPCFVARPGAEAEDDGAVLCMVAGRDGKSYVVVLDAASMQELARCKVDYAIPYGFHGNWFGNTARA